jgi:predicted TIM-barrel fold metal-dependent hydrolase
VTLRDRMILTFMTFFAYGTLERFPRLRLGVLESGAGWIGSLLERMDTVFEHSTGMLAGTMPVALKNKPSEYFRRQCFISCDPDERSVIPQIEQIGHRNFIWASDYPHGDHPSTYASDVVGLVETLGEEARTAVLGRNVVDIYGLAPLSRPSSDAR